jgi:hypothetical protein
MAQAYGGESEIDHRQLHRHPEDLRNRRQVATPRSIPALLREIKDDGTLLLKKEIELARMELREDLRAEAMTVGTFGVAGIGAIVGGVLLLVTAILALARVMPAWAAGLIVSGAVLLASAIAGAVGWSKRVRAPLEKTRESLKGALQWTKKRSA